jgi:hypothetical protein
MLRYERNIETPNKNSEMSKLSKHANNQKETQNSQKSPMFNQLIKQRIIQTAFKKEALNIRLLA